MAWHEDMCREDNGRGDREAMQAAFAAPEIFELIDRETAVRVRFAWAERPIPKPAAERVEVPKLVERPRSRARMIASSYT
jgi:hypothetical protein